LKIRSRFFLRLAWTVVLYFMHPTLAGMTGACYYASFFSTEIGSCKIFASTGLESQSSKVARITGVSHHWWATNNLSL
jgi:hypothetical protein